MIDFDLELISLLRGAGEISNAGFRGFQVQPGNEECRTEHFCEA
jgi:hypothetical protein